MAVYTPVAAEELAAFLERYDLGTLVAAKGIAEGVENSNYLVETTRRRCFLTLYEKRVDARDLPYFLALMEHCADAGLPVPRPIHDRHDVALQQLNGRPACLIEFLPGVSLSEPGAELARPAGEMLAEFHNATDSFGDARENALGIAGRRKLAEACLAAGDRVEAEIAEMIREELHFQERFLPVDLPSGPIHADLFPDNLLAIGTRITGLIDFYFACTDARAYDLAIMHSAWCFSADGREFHSDREMALIAGYEQARPLSDAEREAFPALCRAAALRFLLTRTHDWIHAPAGALVTPKDPHAYVRRLQHYRAP